MNATAFWHLAWKEYRACRGFWLALVALVALADALLTTQVQPKGAESNLVFGLALWAPVLFAVGSAGASFAVEREEGTIEFLREVAASRKHVFASKLTTTAFATAALYLVLLVMAICFTNDAMRRDLHLMVPYSVAIVILSLDGLAWGTLFSLLTTRPLLAVAEALLALACTLAIIGSLIPQHVNESLFLAQWSALVTIVVLAIDLYIGMRWLQIDTWRDWGRIVKRRHHEPIALPPIDSTANDKLVGTDGGLMLLRLLWHQWRQSAPLMIAISATWIGSTIAIELLKSADWFAADRWFRYVFIGAATLMGYAVFQPDQSRHHYRFFVEHNAWPRLVWFTRQIPWLVALAATTVIVYLICMHDIGLLATTLIALGAFTIGQWISMLVRSFVLAIGLGMFFAMIFYGWFWLMFHLAANWTWSIAPIPVVLLAATWLRAPDWVIENRRWSARLRAAAVVLVPIVALVAGVAWFRATQVPPMSPGFDVETSFPDLNPEADAEAHATANLYRQADALIWHVGSPNVGSPEASREKKNPGVAISKILDRNLSIVLQSALEASKHPCEFDDPRTATEFTKLPNAGGILGAVIASGDDLTAKGKLNEALDRYFVAFRVCSQLAMAGGPKPDAIFSSIVNWGAAKGQTTERINAAIARLQKLDSGLLQLDAQLKIEYVVARRRILDGKNATMSPDTGHPMIVDDTVWLAALPSERQRGVRMLDLLTSTALSRLGIIRQNLASNQPVVNDIWPDNRAVDDPAAYFSHSKDFVEQADAEKFAERAAGWLSTTVPSDLEQIGADGLEAASTLVKFEADRRAAMIRLAMLSYRLKHGRLPESQLDLFGGKTELLPRDPYSMMAFVYLPEGVPESAIPFWNSKTDGIVAGVPCIWSPGSKIFADYRVIDNITLTANPYKESARATDADAISRWCFRGGWNNWFAEWNAGPGVWTEGLWFPIPQQKK